MVETAGRFVRAGEHYNNLRRNMLGTPRLTTQRGRTLGLMVLCTLLGACAQEHPTRHAEAPKAVISDPVTAAVPPAGTLEDPNWTAGSGEDGALRREHTFYGADRATRLRVSLTCKPAQKEMWVSIQSSAADGRASKFLSAALAAGASVPVGQIHWGDGETSNLWDYFRNEDGENITDWPLAVSNYRPSVQAPRSGDFIAQLLPISFQGSNQQGVFEVTIPSGNADIENLLQACADTKVAHAAPPAAPSKDAAVGTEVAPLSAAAKAAVEKRETQAYVAHMLATLAQNEAQKSKAGAK
jgi:hypothetical protein